RFYRAQARPRPSHALWLEQAGSESHGREQLGESVAPRAMLKSLCFVIVLLIARTTGSGGEVFLRDSDHDYDAPAPGSYHLPVVKVASDGALLDSTGKSVNLRDLVRGRVTVLSFIYTRCAAPKACPYATRVLSQLHRASSEDSELAKSLRLVSLSF